MQKITDFFEEYVLILSFGFLMGILFILKGYEKKFIRTKSEHFRYVLTGILSSMFITWFGFELFVFLGLPTKLSVAFGGLLAYLGADKIAEFFEIVIKKRLKITPRDINEHKEQELPHEALRGEK